MQDAHQQVDPFARLLVSGYLSAAADVRAFADEWGSPPTSMDKAHRYRSIVQAMVTSSDRYALHPEYMESGRVQVTDRSTDCQYLLRSMSAIQIEAAMRRSPLQLVLFDAPPRVKKAATPDLLAYAFERTGMRLWSSPTKQATGQRRLVPATDLQFVGFWPYAKTTPPTPPTTTTETFDPGVDDPWNDLGNPDVDAGEAGGQ